MGGLNVGEASGNARFWAAREGRSDQQEGLSGLMISSLWWPECEEILKKCMGSVVRGRSNQQGRSEVLG